MTDLLLSLILMTLVFIGWQAHDDHKQLIKWLDAYADMSGDQRRELINKITKGR